jgi:hypothetical protein
MLAIKLQSQLLKFVPMGALNPKGDSEVALAGAETTNALNIKWENATVSALKL